MKKIVILSLGFASGILLTHLFLVPVLVEREASMEQQVRDHERILYLSRQHSYEDKKVRGTPLRVDLSEKSITLAFSNPYRGGAQDAIRVYLTDQTVFQEYDAREGAVGLSEVNEDMLQKLSPTSLISVSYTKHNGRFYAHRISVTYR